MVLLIYNWAGRRQYARPLFIAQWGKYSSVSNNNDWSARGFNTEGRVNNASSRALNFEVTLPFIRKQRSKGLRKLSPRTVFMPLIVFEKGRSYSKASDLTTQNHLLHRGKKKCWLLSHTPFRWNSSLLTCDVHMSGVVPTDNGHLRAARKIVN